MCFVAGSVALTACLLNIHHHSPERPVPAWVRKTVLHYLARALCWRQASCRGTHVIEIEPIMNGNGVNETIEATKGCISNLDAYFLHKLENAKEKSRLAANKTDWEDVARVLDRFFFLLYFMLQLIYVPYIFTPAEQNNEIVITNEKLW